MQSSFHRLLPCLALLCLSALAEDVMVITQDYNIVEQGKDGPQAKDIRQIIYIKREFVCIDEMGGTVGSEKVTESILLDLKNRLIINVNHLDKKKIIESFDERRRRIDEKKKIAREDIKALDAGPQRTKVEKLYRALLDDERSFTLIPRAGPKQEIAGVSCDQVKVHSDKPDYIPLEACLHPEIDLPYDNTEVLYLLRIIGKHMADFLRENKETFKRVPMELHLDLAAGGRLDTKVVSIKQTTSDKLDHSARGSLGNPFDIPAEYSDVNKKPPKPKSDKNKDSERDRD